MTTAVAPAACRFTACVMQGVAMPIAWQSSPVRSCLVVALVAAAVAPAIFHLSVCVLLGVAMLSALNT